MEKKSLVNTLKSNKKPNVIPAPAKKEGVSTRKATKKAAINYGTYSRFARIA